MQVLAPSRPIARGLAGPGLLAHVLVSKHGDHLPLYRQEEIYARVGVELGAHHAGGLGGWREPVASAVGGSPTASRDGREKLHADDTPVPVLAPGLGEVRPLCTYVVTTGRRVTRHRLRCGSPLTRSQGRLPQGHLRHFAGTLQADGYAGFDAVYEPDAYARRRVGRTLEGNSTIFRPPISDRLPRNLERISALYAIEKEIRGRPSDERREIARRRT